MKLFLSHRLYGSRPLKHIAAYHMAPGWLYIEVASWTLEVDYTRKSLAVVLAIAALTAVGAAVPLWDTDGDGIPDTAMENLYHRIKGGVS